METNGDECPAIVIEYLVHYCYEQSAKALLKEIKQLDKCNATSEKDFLVYRPTETEKKKQVHLLDEKDIQWDHISARKSIHHAIQLGDINKAFKLIEHTFPTIITSSTIREGAHRVLYKLRCQQFIEVLRSEGDAEAIQFAQRHLRQSHPHYADLADSVTCLIAYPHDNAYAIKLLSQDRRIAIADEVNQMILEFQHGLSPNTTLERLWRQKITIETELENQKREEMFKKHDLESREKVTV